MKKSEELAAEHSTALFALLIDKIDGKLTLATIKEASRTYNEFLEAIWCEQEEIEGIKECLKDYSAWINKKVKKLETRPFQAGDRVFDIRYGWGTVRHVNMGDSVIHVFFDLGYSDIYLEDGRCHASKPRTLSHQEYSAK